MIYVHVRHKVADFVKWKTVYDAHLAARQKAGLREKDLLRNIENPNELIVILEADDLKKAQDFVGSADLRDAMQGRA
ncbi:cyclase [Nitrospira sp. Nam74]